MKTTSKFTWFYFLGPLTLTTDINLKHNQLSKLGMEFNMRNKYICSIVHVRTYRKDDIFIQRKSGKGPKAPSFLLMMEPFNNSFIDKADVAVDIFRFAVFFLIGEKQRFEAPRTWIGKNLKYRQFWNHC